MDKTNKEKNTKYAGRAVIYARFSSGKQREESIEGQIRVCTDFAKRNNMKVIGHYADRAISGRRDTRAQFQKMMEDSLKRMFDYVIVYQHERFARNRYDSAIYKWQLRKCGVRVISALEYFGDGPEAILFETWAEGNAEYFSADLARKVKRGMTENALKGKWNGTCPLGYIIGEDKRLKINPKTAPLVRKIFRRFVDGAKMVDIIKELSPEYFALTGKKFQRTSFSKMLTNETYIGVYSWNGITVDNAVPPIIKKEVFLMAKDRVEKQKRNKPVYTSDIYLLTAKIKCARCGAFMTGMSGTSRNGVKHYYYVCNNQRRNKSCDMKAIKVDTIEQAVINNAMSILNDEKSVDLIADEAIKLLAQSADGEQEVEILKNERKEVEKKINNCLMALENGVISDSIVERIAENEARLKSVDNEIEHLSLMNNPLSLTKERIIYFLMHGLKGKKRREFILSTLVKEVLLNYDSEHEVWEMSIAYNYSNNCNECNKNDNNVRKVKIWYA